MTPRSRLRRGPLASAPGAPTSHAHDSTASAQAVIRLHWLRTFAPSLRFMTSSQCLVTLRRWGEPAAYFGNPAVRRHACPAALRPSLTTGLPLSERACLVRTPQAATGQPNLEWPYI